MKRQQLANGPLPALISSRLLGLELAPLDNADRASEAGDEDDGACKSRIKTRDSDTASLGAVVCDGRWEMEKQGKHYF